MSKNKVKQNRKFGCRVLKAFARIKYRRPKFVYLGDKPTTGALILSNHEGASSPLVLENYAEFPFRMWGTYEMNSGFKQLYRYLTRTYYHEKRHWNLHLARLFCLVAAPLTYVFYNGLNLISTYRDARFLKTIKESISVIEEGKENIVIFPERSEKGYFKVLEGFYAGFVVLAHKLYQKGIDVPIYVAYYKVKENAYVFDKPIRFSEISAQCETRYEMAKLLMDRCNTIGSRSTDSEETEAAAKAAGGRADTEAAAAEQNEK